MSGLEALGAFASVVGVAGTIKTCIDLLDIVSSARSTERDLEDLLVHVQWQRIRFYCWVLETGFADVIVSEQQNTDESSPDPGVLLSFLPREFRFPFFLLHIQRTIANMNMRLQAAEQIVQKYCPVSPRPPRTWRERIAHFLDTTPTSAVDTLPPAPIQSPKLGLWDKMWWVGRHVKELTHLTETLRQYNTELEALLPLSRAARLERRVERGLTTSRRLSGRLAAPDFAGHVAVDSEGLRQARHYRSLITLLESSNQPQGQPPIELRGEQAETTWSARGPKSDWPVQSLRLDVADLKFVSSKATERVDREFVSYGPTPVILEWRYYSTKMTAGMRSYLDCRVHSLAMQLRQLSTVSDVGTLSCLGYFHSEKRSGYGLVFEYPKGWRPSTPISLRQRLKSDHKARHRRDLDVRFDFARAIVLSMYRLLSVNWLHKNLSSENVLLFEDGLGQDGCEKPYLCGFSHARRDAEFELTEKPASVYQETPATQAERLYWHPDRLAAFQARDEELSWQVHDSQRSSYRREFDVYSLGIVLLEIGFWCPIERIYQEHGSDESAFAAKLQDRYLPALKARMGKTYSEVVGSCLEGRFGGSSEEQCVSADGYLLQVRSFLEEFETQVMSKMERIVTGE